MNATLPPASPVVNHHSPPLNNDGDDNEALGASWMTHAPCAMHGIWLSIGETRNVGYYQDPKDQVAYNQDDDGDDELEVL